MRAFIEKGVARGSVTAPASKSICHRLIIAAAMCDGVSRLHGISLCADCLATIDCLRALGVDMSLDTDVLTVRGNGFKNAKPKDTLYARESGSTLRFLIPLALLSGRKSSLPARKDSSKDHTEYTRKFARSADFYLKGGKGKSL